LLNELFRVASLIWQLFNTNAKALLINSRLITLNTIIYPLPNILPIISANGDQTVNDGLLIGLETYCELSTRPYNPSPAAQNSFRRK